MPIRALTSGDAHVYRAVRLDALRADPEAFRSTYEREASFDDDTWRSRLAGYDGRPGQVFVSSTDDRTVGVVGIGALNETNDAVLWGMWVGSEQRGAGVGRQLVDACIEWALVAESPRIVLWVRRSNTAAQHLYERAGFVPASAIELLATDAPPSCRDEVCLVRPMS